MDYQQILSKAKAECVYIGDKECVKVFIASSIDNPLATAVFDVFRKEADKSGVRVEIFMAGSFGYYDLEPIVRIDKSDKPVIFYHNITSQTASELVNDYLIMDNSRPDLALCAIEGDENAGIPNILNLPLFNQQNRIALRNCGHIDPGNIYHYILFGKGFAGLNRVLQAGKKNVIQELKRVGLRGRGGAGYFTADKWQICHDMEVDEKYVICNAIDADPVARTAKLLLEGDPYSVLEGVLIGAYAVGAHHAYICINNEYANAKATVVKALEQMRSCKLLSNEILNSGFSCDIELKELSSSLISGEETALLSALEEKQMMPYLHTTYPAESGLYGKPTLINNLETMSNVSHIFQHNLGSLSDIGTEKSRGTKVITLNGQIVHNYTLEVPFGITLRTLIEDLGGGVQDRKEIKAVQIGGPTGAYLAGSSLDIGLSYETMEAADAIIGSGTIKVYDENSCAVEMAMDIMSYLQAQSCGKCVFCREGTYQMLSILNDISTNQGREEDLDLLNELGEGMKVGSICGLGTTAPAPVLSSIRLFRNDYDAHIKEKSCRKNNTL